MDEAQYHVMLDGKKVGPYDRRTIVGMRIRGTLGNEHVLLTPEGVQLTVADIVKAKKKEPKFAPERSGTYSLVQATYTACLVGVKGRGFEIPDFRGEMEARVQNEVLRIAGRFRQGFQWKEDRVKLPLGSIAHARIRGSLVDLWLRAAPDRKDMQRLTLELFTHEDAGELVEYLPNATPFPGSETGPTRQRQGASPLIWAVVVGAVLAVGAIALWVAVAANRF